MVSLTSSFQEYALLYDVKDMIININYKFLSLQYIKVNILCKKNILKTKETVTKINVSTRVMFVVPGRDFAQFQSANFETGLCVLFSSSALQAPGTTVNGNINHEYIHTVYICYHMVKYVWHD